MSVPFSPRRRSLALGAAAVVLGVGACSRAHVFHGVDITGVPYASGFDLTDFNGRRRSLADFAGKAVVVYFGYTQCPDVCPQALQVMNSALDLLGDKARDVQFLFVTVDPQRDTPAILKAYVTGFNPSFLALTGTPAQIDRTARDFKVYFKRVPGARPGSYTVDHTAAFFLFDPKGRVRVYEPEGIKPRELADDLRALIDGH